MLAANRCYPLLGVGAVMKGLEMLGIATPDRQDSGAYDKTSEFERHAGIGELPDDGGCNPSNGGSH